MESSIPTLDGDRALRRIRHETRRRHLIVQSVHDLTPGLRRIILGGDLEGFVSAGFDDHVKLFFACPNADGPVMRDFTPRHFDAAAHTLTIDFALHEAGPASDWARNASSGDGLDIGGPRGSVLIPPAFDWYLLVGDETALPAIARRLEELPAGTRALAVIAVEGPAFELHLDSAADVTLVWVHRPAKDAADPAPLIAALADLAFPAGDGFHWIAAEAGVTRAVRQWLESARGANPHWMQAKGYWQKGQAQGKG